MALRTHISSVVTPAAQAEGVSEDFYFLQHLSQASKGNEESLAIIESVRTVANLAGDTAATTELDSMIADSEVLTEVPANRLWVDPSNGSDVTGNGSFSKPFAGVEVAMAATTTGTWVIYILSGADITVSSSFILKPDVWLIALSAERMGISRSDSKEIPNAGTVGRYSYTNINFSSGLRTTAPSSSQVHLDNCSIGSVRHVYQVAAVADVSSSLAGKYFLIDTPLMNYYHYYTVGGIGVDPAVASRKRLVTDLVANDSAATVATKTNTSLGTSLQIRQHTNDFTITTSGAPSGSFRISPFIGVETNIAVTDFDTGFTVSTTTQGSGLQILGISIASRPLIQIDRSSIGSMFVKFGTGSVSQSTVTNLMVDGGPSAGGAASITYNDVIHTTTQLKGNSNIIKSGVRQQGSPTLANMRVIGPAISGAPFISLDDAHLYGIQRTLCSTTTGSSVITIPAGQKTSNAWAVGNAITGPQIPANSFVGESQDLTTTQVRLVDLNGTAVNATQTRTSNYLTTRRGVFQDGLTHAQISNGRNSNNIQYTLLTAADWPSTAPFNVTQALDVLASKKLTKENITVSAGDVTNQYIDLTNTYIASTLDVSVRPAATPTVFNPGFEGAGFEYTLTTYSDANSITRTRLTFVTNWTTGGDKAILAGDVVHIQGLIQTDNF